MKPCPASNLVWQLPVSLLLLPLFACSEKNADNGYAEIGTTTLSLQAAPPGLCGGDGSQKDCGDDCPEPTDGARGDTGGTAGLSGVSGQNSAPMYSAAPDESWGDSDGADIIPIEPIASPDAAVPDSGVPDAGRDAGCVETLPDGGVVDTCMMDTDGGLASAQAALITPEVPDCSNIDGTEPYKLYLSADDSNSMASPAIARRMIENGQRVPASVVRSYEFLNYYDFSFEPAEPGQVRIVPQLSSCPVNDQLSLQVALQAEQRDPETRQLLNLTFVLDTSGSMGSSQFAGPTPIVLQREAVKVIAAQLREGDIVSMVTWDTNQRELLGGHVVTEPNDPVILEAIDATSAAGGTDLHGGLVRGYQLAAQHRSPNRINRVIVISDGRANVGLTDEALIGQYADDEEGDAGIYLAGIGVGDGFNDTLMDVITDLGRGAYIYLDSLDEAQHMLGERFLSVVDLAARSVRLEITLPWYLTLEKFYGEVASTDPDKVRPQHLGPNDAMLFFQVLQACDASLLHGDDRITLKATWETPFSREAREVVIDTTLNELAGDDRDMEKAAAIAGYAEALIEFDSAGDTPQGRNILQVAMDNVRAAKGADTDRDLLEVAHLLELYMASQTSAGSSN